MKETVEEIQTLLREHHIEIYGIADSKKMANVRPGNRPEDILPDAKSILCIAVPFPKGIYAMKRNMELGYWWNSNLYFNRIENLMLQVCNILEKKGYSAMVINGCFPLDVNFNLEFIGYVSQIHMAQAAKIGKIGKNGLIFHPEYGPRLILGGILTSAPLPEMTTVPETDLIDCPDGCNVCQEKCPAKAIDKNGKVNIRACVMHSGVSPIRFLGMPFFRIVIPILSKLKLVNDKRFLPQKLQRLFNITFANNHGMFHCINCVSMCPYLSEGTKKVA